MFLPQVLPRVRELCRQRCQCNVFILACKVHFPCAPGCNCAPLEKCCLISLCFSHRFYPEFENYAGNVVSVMYSFWHAKFTSLVPQGAIVPLLRSAALYHYVSPTGSTQSSRTMPATLSV